MFKFNNCVNDCRKAACLSQLQLAELVGVSRNTIASIERNEHEPSGYTLLAICKVLGKPVETIFWLDKL